MKTILRTQRQRLRQPAVFAWLRLARVFQKIDTLSERFFRTHELNTAQFDILATIGANDGLTQQDLASALLVTKGNVSQLLGKMEHEGLVIRRQVGRTNYLSLSDQGQTLFERVVPQQETLIADLLHALSAEEQHELLRLLRKLDHAIAT